MEKQMELVGIIGVMIMEKQMETVGMIGVIWG